MENVLIQKLLDFNPEAAFIAGKQTGTVFFFNKAIGKEPGFENLVEKNIFDLIVPSEKEKLLRLFGCKSGEEDFHFHLNNGSLSACRLSAAALDDDKVLCSFRRNTNPLDNLLQFELFNMLNDAVIVTDTELNITAWNKAAEKIYGWTESEARGKKLGSLPISEMTESERNLSLFELENKGSHRMIATQRNKNGQPVFVDANTFIVKDGQGKTTGYVSVNSDVTSKLDTLNDLKSSEERYRQLFDETPLPVIIFRQDDLLILNVNNAAVKKFGYTIRQFLEMKITKLVPPESMVYFNKVTSPESRKKKREGTSLLLTASGEKINIEYTSTYIVYKASDARLVVYNDITERLKAEEKLRDSSAKLNTIINNLPMVLLEADQNGKFILEEGKALSDVGFKPGELVGQSVNDVFGDVMVTRPTGEYIPIKKAVSELMKGELVSGHTTFRRRHFDNYFVPLKNEDEKVTGLLGICLDITDRINLEKSFHQTEERFQLIAEVTSDLISMVSDNKYIYLSPSYEKLFGYTLEEIKKLGPYALIHPDDRDLAKGRQNKGPAEFRVRNKNGDLLWIEGESYTISGDPEITVVIARDFTKRKIAEQALKDSEERYRILFERNPLPMFVYNTVNRKFLTANEAAIRHYGYSVEELMEMTIMDIRPEEDVPLLKDYLLTLEPGMNFVGAWRHRKKSGEVIDVEITSHDITFKGITSRIVLANDVTQKMKAAKALKQSEEKYRRIVENANEGIWLFNNKWETTFANRKLAGILGYKVKEMENKSLFDFIYDADKKKAGKYLHKIRKGSRETIKLRLKHKDGSERWISSNAVPVLSDEMEYTGALALVTDVTSEKKYQEILQRTNEMLNALINCSPLSIMILDKDGNTELWNPASESMFGWRSEEILGAKPPFAGAEKDEERKAMRKLVLSGKSFTGREVTRLRKDGKKIEVSISASPMFDNSKKPIGIASFLMDITERKLAEKEREKLFREINNARKSLKILSSKLIRVQEDEKRNISRELHDEIGQILTAIKIDLQRIMSEPPDNSSALVDDCTALVEKTISIVRDLSHELHPAIIDDLGLIAALRSYIEKFSERTGIKIKLHSSNIDKFIPSGSAIALFRVCQEALTNIAKHSRADYVEVWINQKNRNITLSIEDNGKGFDPKKALKLAAKGESLGLLSMQERVELLNGKLKIISSEKSGTKIKVKCQI